MRDRPSPLKQRARDPLVGTVIGGRFRIEARIGSGGMGSVYRAEQLGLDRKVALKILDPSVLEGASLVDSSQSGDDVAVLERRFSREASILARLSHPNVVTVFDYGRIDDVPASSTEPGRSERVYRPRFYMAMELLGGETLQERLHKRKKLPPDEVIALARQVGRGLREAHALGIVHRDLKPANVMVVRDRDGDEVWKILDFGIGKIVDQEMMSTADARAELTQEGRFVGSPLYMAPEQISHGEVDARVDLYSFGVLLYRCLAGVHPFHKENTALVLLAHLQEAPAPIRERAPEVPEWLARVVHQCLEKERDRRPRAMEDILRTIAEATREGPNASGSYAHATAPEGVLPVPRVDSGVPPPRYAEEATTFGSGQRAGARPQEMPTEAQHTPHTTHRPAMLADARPQPPRSPIPYVLMGLVGFVAIALVTAFLARSPNAVPAPSTAPSTPNAPASSVFRLVIDSTPAGAEVREGTRVHGLTPIEITIEQESVQSSPRMFVLHARGYEPRTITQGPSKEAVRLSIELHPVPAALPTPTTVSTSTAAAKAVPKPAAKPVPSATAPPKTDIILER